MAQSPFALPPTTRVLVTAGASGIGRAIADLFLDQGAQVHICDVSDTFLADFRSTHPKAGCTKADVSSDSEVKHLFDEIEKSLGGLDILVNNAGIAGPTGGVDEISSEEWRRTLDICLTGQYLCAHHAVPMLKQAGGGAITVNMLLTVNSSGQFITSAGNVGVGEYYWGIALTAAPAGGQFLMRFQPYGRQV